MKYRSRTIIAVSLLTNLMALCFVRTYKLYLLKNYAEQLNMFPQETIDKFLQLSKEGAIQDLHRFITDFENQGVVAAFAKMLNSVHVQSTLYNFLHRYGVQGLHNASTNGHSDLAIYLLDTISAKAPDLQLGVNDCKKLLQDAISLDLPKQIDYICNYIFKVSNAAEMLNELNETMPSIINLEFSYKGKQTTVLVRIFRHRLYELALFLAKTLDLESLLKKDTRSNSALTNAIRFRMEEVATIILQRISGNLSGTFCIDDFDEWSFLGKGGFAEVYKAKDSNDQWVALKKTQNDKHVDLSVQEMQILSELKGGGIIECIGAFVNIGKMYLVLEYAAGINLLQFYNEELITKQDPDEHYTMVAEIAYKMQEILCYLYISLIIHLDIKLENVMIECRRGEISLKLIDFALSIKTDENQVASIDDVKGTLGCMAPEIVKDHYYLLYKKAQMKVSSKADVFSNGVMIYELLARIPGRYLFMRNTQAEIMHATLNVKHKWPTTLMVPMYSGLREYVDKSLEKDPRVRPNAAELCNPRVQKIGI